MVFVHAYALEIGTIKARGATHVVASLRHVYKGGAGSLHTEAMLKVDRSKEAGAAITSLAARIRTMPRNWKRTSIAHFYLMCDQAHISRASQKSWAPYQGEGSLRLSRSKTQQAAPPRHHPLNPMPRSLPG